MQKIRRHLFPVLLNVGLAGLCLYYLDSLVGVRAGDKLSGVSSQYLRLLQFSQIVAFAYTASHVAHFAYELAAARKKIPVPKLVLHISTFILYAAAVSLGLNLVYHYSLDTILAASGILTFVLGFALRGLLSDIISGVALHLDDNVSIGDWLQFSVRGTEFTAKLMEFDWRCTVLHDLANNAILIPNSEFSMLRLNNMTKPTPYTEASARIDLSIGQDIPRVIRILQNSCNYVATQGHVMADPGPYIRIGEASKGIITFVMYYSIAPHVARGRARHFILDAAIGFLKAAGIPVLPVLHEHVVAEHQLTADLLVSDVRLRILAQLPLFSVLSRTEAEFLAARTAPVQVEPGTVLIEEKATGSTMYIVLEGTFDVIVTIKGAPVSVAKLWPRDVVGEMSLFTGAPRTATVVAISKCTIMEITKESMSALFELNPSLLNAFAAQIDARTLANKKISEKTDQVESKEKKHSILSDIKSFFGFK